MNINGDDPDDEPTQEEVDAYELSNRISHYSAQFDHLLAERHAKGQEEYGALTFLGNDVVRMMMEELADTANYCRYQFVKLMFLQNQLEQMMSEDPTGLLADGEQLQLGIGWQPMKGTKDVGWT